MNKLVSKNPVLRFKLGKKIVKAYRGWEFDPLRLPERLLGRAFKKISDLTKPETMLLRVNRVQSEAEAIGRDYGNAYRQTYKDAYDLIPLKKNVLKQPYFLKAYAERAKLIGGTNKITEWLKKLGVKADGIWGKNTEAAFIKKFGFNPNTDFTETSIKEGELENIAPKTIKQPINYLNDFALDKSNNYSGTIEKVPVILAPYIPLGFGALLAQAAKQYTKLAKQGGQLVSKNPVKRFKEGSSFGKAFRQARNSGLKEFTWNGRRYTTELKEEKEAREKKQSPKINNNDHSPLDMKKKSIKKDGKNYAYTKNGNLREIKDIYS